MYKGIKTFIQPGWKLLRRADETLMRKTSHVYRQILLELVDENEASEAKETLLAEVDENVQKHSVKNSGKVSPGHTSAAGRSKGYQCLFFHNRFSRSVVRYFGKSKGWSRVLGLGDLVHMGLVTDNVKKSADLGEYSDGIGDGTSRKSLR